MNFTFVVFFLLNFAANVTNGIAPFYADGENLSAANCGIWHRHENHSSWFAYLRHEGEECYGIVISRRTILTHKPDECRIQVREVGKVIAYLGECASASKFDSEECVGKHIEVQKVVAINQNPSAGEDGVYVRLYKTKTKMPENVPICLYNRDRATDFPQSKDSKYFSFQRFRDASKNDEWWDQLELRILVSSEECFKNQNFDKKELEKMNLSPRRLLCVHTPNEDGRYLLNFYRGRYFLRGVRVFHPLLPSRTKIYRDILPYVKHISRLADDIPVFPPVPPEIQAIEFSIQGNLSFQNCGSKWIRSKRSNDDPTADGFEETKFVFSGYTAREDSHPWHADIENLENGTQCGGTLISSRTVLTAAHCIFEMNVKDFEVTVGMYDKTLKYNDTKIQIKTPSKLVTHPAYRSDQFHYDVGLLIFEQEGFEINNQVRPICLWNEGSSLSRVTGKSAVLVGFGLTEHYSLSDTLQEARLSIRKHEECYLSNRILFGKRLRPGDNFCAGFTNGVSACLGDSGGSLSIKKNGRWFIRGIVSFGLSKRVILDGEEQIACNPNSFSLYADVAYYMDWIVRNSLDISFKN